MAGNFLKMMAWRYSRVKGWGLRMLLWVVALGVNSCGDRQETAKRELHARDFAFTVEDYMRAAKEGDAVALKRFLDAGMKVDVQDGEANTALFRAALHGRTEAVKLLLARGAAVDVAGTGWDTPLMAAARAGSAETVQALLDAGADAEKRSEKNWTALTAAAYAGHAEVVRILADRSRRSLDEALQIACLQGKTPVIDALLTAGASVFSRSKDNKTPMMYAAMNGHLDAVKLLVVHGANRFALDSKDRTAADHAQGEGHTEVVAFLNDPQAPMIAERAGEQAAAATEEVPFAPDAVETPDRSAEAPPSPAQVAGGEGASAPPGAVPNPLDGAGTTPTPAGEAPARSRPGPTRSSAIVYSKANRRPVPPINGARVEALADGAISSVQARLEMRDYRETQLPIVLERVGTDEGARIRVLYRGDEKAGSFAPGTAIADTGLEVVKTERRFRSSKSGIGREIDVSRAVVRDRATGQRHLVVANTPAHASEASAVVGVKGSDTIYEVREGDEFTVGSDQPVRYRVLDIRPTQVVLEDPASGETLTLPRGRGRGR